jgi:hypothetical protein
LPTPLDIARNVDGTGLSRADLPFEAGALCVSQPSAP